LGVYSFITFRRSVAHDPHRHIAAFEAIAGTIPPGSVAYETEANERGERTVWLDEVWVDRLAAMRGQGEATATSSCGSRLRNRSRNVADKFGRFVTVANFAPLGSLPTRRAVDFGQNVEVSVDDEAAWR
jgi:hypothetical protein